MSSFGKNLALAAIHDGPVQAWASVNNQHAALLIRGNVPLTDVGIGVQHREFVQVLWLRP